MIDKEKYSEEIELDEDKDQDALAAAMEAFSSEEKESEFLDF